MKDSVIRARIGSDLKARALQVLASCGLEPSDAIRLFLQQVVAHNGIPFPIRARHEEPAEAPRPIKRVPPERDRAAAANQEVSSAERLAARGK